MIYDYCDIILSMIISNDLSDAQILSGIANRLKNARIQKEYTQAELAEISGVSKGTVENLEKGESVQLSNLIKILRSLGLIDLLNDFITDEQDNDVLCEGQPKKRQRIRKPKKSEVDYRWH